jgi:hypothetical protein
MTDSGRHHVIATSSAPASPVVKFEDQISIGTLIGVSAAKCIQLIVHAGKSYLHRLQSHFEFASHPHRGEKNSSESMLCPLRCWCRLAAQWPLEPCLYGADDVLQVPNALRQPVDARDHENVALAQEV